MESLAGLVPYMAADLLYSSELYEFSKRPGIVLVCPIKRYRHTKGVRLKRYRFSCSRKGRRLRRRATIERMFDRMKDTSGISPIPVRGERNVSSYVLMCVFVYQVAIYYNSITGRKKPVCQAHAWMPVCFFKKELCPTLG